ncbi:MAG: thiolase domain-containing protein, partial [Aigarchaeota archaeon]|nr:thiolase domain-containing protein [Aigarchaeota archaeon]
MRKVAVVGIGHSKFGKRTGLTIRELSHEAVTPALQDAGLTPKDIDAAVVAVAGEEFAAQGCPAATVGDYVGLLGKTIYRVEAACASGSAGVRTAWTQIASGLADIVLATGVETMRHMSSERATELMARAGDALWEYPYGVSFPAFYALMATAHMAEYGTTREQLSSVSVKNHKYGALNPYAQFYQKPVTLEAAMKSVMISHPLNLYDCCPISDGAAAVILASEEKARQLTDTPVWMIGLGGGSDTMQISERQSLTGLLG